MLRYILPAIFTPMLTYAQQAHDYPSIFSGDWVSYATDFSTGAPCQISLSSQSVGSGYGVETQHCRAELAQSAIWAIDQSQLVLRTSEETLLFRLGGSPAVLSGESHPKGDPLIIERAQVAKDRYDQRKSIGCSYLGYSQTCAQPEDYAPPTENIKILVDLNGRAEPRDDAPIVTIKPEKTCLSSETCTQSSSGLWCKTSVDSKILWIKKQTERQSNWHVITFLSGC
jgi:hypothetical protein